MTRGLLKSGKTGQYASDYFYDLVSMEEAISEPERDASGDPGPRSPSGTGTPGPAIFPPLKDDQQWRDPVRASIERQVALKAAVELAGYKIATGKDLGAREVMAVATLFDRWLGRHFEVDSQEQEA